MKLIMDAIRGFCMALADSVPGVSGGTIAFILGFYDKFIKALNDIFYGSMKDKKLAIIFLFRLGIGWIIGMILAILILTSLFENNIYKVSSLFIGFILFSIPLIIKEEKQVLKGKYINLLFTLIGIVIVFSITYLNPTSGAESSINLANADFKLFLYLFISGMIAISAMVLPGISGSTILLIFGVYLPVISAIKEILTLNLSYFPALFVFGLGVITGVFLIIKLVKLALEKQRSKTIYCIIGLMIGSIYAIILGPTTLEIPKVGLSLETFSVIFCLIGGFIIFGLDRLKLILENKEKEQ